MSWAPDPDAVIAEMQEEIEGLEAAQKETFEVLWRIARANVELEEQVTRLQSRCTELLEENRSLKRALEP